MLLPCLLCICKISEMIFHMCSIYLFSFKAALMVFFFFNLILPVLNLFVILTLHFIIKLIFFFFYWCNIHLVYSLCNSLEPIIIFFIFIQWKKWNTRSHISYCYLAVFGLNFSFTMWLVWKCLVKLIGELLR